MKKEPEEPTVEEMRAGGCSDLDLCLPVGVRSGNLAILIDLGDPMGLLRKVRGVIGNGLLWAGAWIVGKASVLGAGALLSGLGIPWSLLPAVIASAAVTGFMNGVLFSAVFAVVNRRRSLAEIPPFRTGLLGLTVGAVLPVVQVATAAALGLAIPASAIAFGLVVGGGLGTATAVGSLRLAQSAERTAFERPRGEPMAIGP